MKSPAIMKSQSEDWGTPYDLFNYLEEMFGKFDLDAAADSNWHMVSEYLTKEDNALDPGTMWKGQNIYINPPYDQETISSFIDRAITESMQGKKVTLLLPAKTDQKWFKKCLQNDAKILFISGRVSFRDKDQLKKQNATFLSVVIHFGSKDKSIGFISYNEVKNKYKIGK